MRFENLHSQDTHHDSKILHPYQSSIEDFPPPEPTHDRSRRRLRTDHGGRWVFDRSWLHNALVDGLMHLSDSHLQATFLDYIETLQFSEFYNQETGETFYIPVAKRGNFPYAVKKGAKRDEILEALSKVILDEPIPGSKNLRRTRALFITLTFDPRKYTAEEAWSSLKSTRPEGSSAEYNVINNLAANISRIFGTNGKLVSKEAQANGYPAPHLLIILDEPVIVRRRRIKGDLVRWFIDDEEILKRLGKDKSSRDLFRKDYKKAIDSNPIWKHGFFDIEGVVSETGFKGRKSVVSYLFKYMCKCLTENDSDSTADLPDIKAAKDHNLLVALWTHFCNKCFCNRDITYGKGFKERVGLALKKVVERKEPSKWMHMCTIDEPTYERIMKERKQERLLSLGLDMEGSDVP